MGYRGEDASRTRADSRRQPWQSSSSAGAGVSGSWDDGSLGYGQDDDYAAPGDYRGYAPDDSYAGYEDYGQGSDGAPGGYAAPGGYDAADGHGAAGEHGATGRHAATGRPGRTDGYTYPDDSGYADTDGYANGSGYPGATGYANGDSYASGGGYPDGAGYTNDDGYPNGSGHATDGRYAANGGYAASDGYVDSGGYANDDGYGAQYGQSASHDQQSNYGGYRDMSADGDFGSGPYEQQQADLGHFTGGYPARGYGRSGGYPALEAGSSGRDAGGYTDTGNDWYNAQPAAASGSGFADTGTFDARAVGAYGTGPRHAARDLDGYAEREYYDGFQGDASSQLTVHDPVRGFPPSPTGPRRQLTAAPQDLVDAGQQERYDDGQYDSYAGYDQGAYDDAQGYGPAGGYQTTRGYDQYDEPDAFGARGYEADPDYDAGSALDLPPGYDEDPYQERYGDSGTGPRPGAPGGKDRSGKKKAGGRRVKLLLLSAAAVVVVGIAGAAAYTFILKPKPTASNSTLSTGPLPSTGSSSAATSACVQQLGPYCHIELRTEDPVPLTLAELFPPAFLNESDHMSYARLATKLDKTCSNAVIGQDLISALQSDKCTQVLRASYASADNTIMGTIGIANLATTNEAHHAGKLVGANDFVAPLSTSKGIGSKLGSGTGVVQAEFKGHYLILIWAEFATGKAPKTPAQDHQLSQFEADLVAGTANPALSERMVNGSPPTPGAS